jgi:hypothetical protein
MTKRKQLRWIFDAVMRARGWTDDEAERAWIELVSDRDGFGLVYWDSHYRAEWASIQAGWRPRVPTSADEVRRWFDADRLVNRT